MENHINQIELINQYINGQLSASERQSFENQLQSNPEFNNLYLEQLTFLEGLKRVQLKAEIGSAKSSYLTAKWLKIIGLPVLFIGFGVLCYSLFFNQPNTENQQEINQEQNTVPKSIDSLNVDSDLNEKIIDSSKRKFIVIKRIETQIADKKLTNIYGGVTIIHDTILIENLGYFTKTQFDHKFLKYNNLRPINDTLIIKEKRPFKGDDDATEKTIISEEKSQVSTLKNSTTLEIEEIINNDIIAFYQSVKKAPQIIEFNNEKPFEITCKEGTKLTIPAKCFVDKNTGKLARGIITLEATEYYKLSDMLLANLSTKSYDKLLETGGMLNINAYKGDELIQLKSGSKIRIQFPVKDKKGMQLFSGIETSNDVNWKLQNQSTQKEVVTVSEVHFLSEEDVQVPLNIVEEPPIFPSCENAIKEEKVNCFSDAVQTIVEKNFDSSIAEDLNLKGKHNILVSFVVNKNGKVDQIQVRASNTKLAEEAVRLVNLIPQMIPAKQRGFNVIVPYSFPISFQVGESVKVNPSSIVFKGETQFEKQMEKRLVSKDSVNITGQDYSRYVFTTSGLGWINCDRFVRAKNTVKFKLKIKDAKGADVKLVFKSISSILPSKKYGEIADFGDVPTNEDVILIAIKKVEDKLFLGIKETTTKPITTLDLDFKEVSVEELKSQLQALNNDFN